MSRAAPLRRACPDAVRARIPVAQATRLHVVQVLGPTAFVVRAPPHAAAIATLAGTDAPGAVPAADSTDPPATTSLPPPPNLQPRKFKLWVMIKMFRVPAESELLYQTSLVEREVAELLDRRRAKSIAPLESDPSSAARASATTKAPPGQVARRPVDPGDV
ncbi:hypothetical protein HK405_011066, partial [Cladochytrium tenue]